MKKISVLCVLVSSLVAFVGCGGYAMPDMDSGCESADSGHPTADASPETAVTDAGSEAAPPDAAPPGTTALVVEFTPVRVVVHSDAVAWQKLGTVVLGSYGGDSIFSGSQIAGANIGLVSDLTIARNGIVVGQITHPVAACSCGEMRLLEPVTIHDSEHVVYEVWGRIPARSPYSGAEVTFWVEPSITASAVGGGSFAIVQPFNGVSEIRIWNAFPVIAPQPLATTDLVNDADQDLFSFRVRTEGQGGIEIGSFTFRFGYGVAAYGTISHLRMRVGTAYLDRSEYHLYRAFTGEEIVDTSTVDSRDMVTFVPDFLGGMTVSGAGETFTLTGTPTGFPPRSELHILFGDRLFSSTTHYDGNMTTHGLLTYRDASGTGLEMIDPIVWSDRAIGGIFTGAWQLNNLDVVQILRAP